MAGLGDIVGSVLGGGGFGQNNNNGGMFGQNNNNGGMFGQQGDGFNQQGGYNQNQGYNQNGGGFNPNALNNPQYRQELPAIQLPPGVQQQPAVVVNELYLRAYCYRGSKIHSKAGAMVGFRGKIHFEKELLGPGGNPLGALLSQIGRRLTGENLPLMACTGDGEIYFACNAQHVTLINLNHGETVSVESENILAFSDSCRYSGKFLAQGLLSQKGLFTSTLTGNGSGAWAAILTSGNPLTIPTPCAADPDALVAWTGADPIPKLDLSFKNIIGQASGESYNFQFNQPGGMVIIQPDERRGGISIGID